jgi:ankyrin repeat protein
VRFKHFQCANILKPVAGEGFAVITTGNGDLIPNDAFEIPTHSTEKQSLLLKKIETDTFSSKKATSDWKDAIDSEAAVRTLMQAVSDGDQEEFMRLIAKGADPGSCDYDGRTPLHLASCFGHLKIVLYLLTQARVDPNCFDRFGRTPLQDAVTYGHPEITAVLKANGATVTDAGLGKKLCQAAFSGNLEALIQLEHMGANLNCGDYDGRTALHLASSEGHLEIVQWLLSKNVHTSATDRWGGTPLGDAVRSGHRVIVEYLEHQCHK